MSEDASLNDFTDAAEVEETHKGCEKELFGLGKIPTDWSIEPLSDIATIVQGNSPPSSTYNDKEEGIPFFQGNSEFGHFHPVADTWCSEPKKEAEKNNILISVRAPVGDLNIADRNCCIGRGLAALQPGSINGLYLYYNLTERRSWLSRLSTGSTFKSITKGDLQLLNVPVPPLREQRKVATILYTIDQGIEKSKKIEAQLDQTQKGLIQDFLTRGLQESETVKTGTKLGEIPSHWEVVAIEDILSDEEYSFTDGARYSLSSDEIQESGDARAILLEEVREGEFNDSSPKFATEEKYNEITHRAIYSGEVVVAKMAEPVVRACIVPDTYEKYLLGCADVVRIVPNDEIEDRFLMYCMNSHKVWRQAVAHLRGTGRSRINLENISELYIPKPPLSEQRDMVSILTGIDQQIENEQEYRNNLQRLKRGLQQDLLSGTVRTTDTNIEVPDEIAQHG
ncbi:restriction endonuclease subunit S [Halorubrum sp. AS12]|uniref:restriction endonuclease subunit S n=1 Tax=Halorubrum sp. AS12 TaxID=3409687 RepID=UPI003DA70747